MFSRLVQWIRGVFRRMIGQSTIKEKLRVDVALSADMTSALERWTAMYENRASWLSAQIKSLNLPAAIAGEIARAVTIEMQVSITGSPRAEFLAAQFATIMPRLREMVEKGCAKGGLIFKPWVDDQRIAVNFVQADQFYPVSFDSDGHMTGCIFADQRQIGNDYYTRLEYHQMTGRSCVVVNQAFKSSSRDDLGFVVSLSAVPEWADLLPEATIESVERPLFAYFKFPLANNIDTTSPLGVSCYGRAESQIEEADRQWSRLLWEFESGERALYVDDLAFDHDSDGKPVLPNKRLYRALKSGGNVGDDALFEDWTPTIREQNLLNGLEAILRRIEFQCGLAYGTLSNPQSVEKTATEIAASRQRSQATITDTQKALQEALNHLLYAMDVWATLNNLAPAGSYTATYDFDDSLVTDSEAQFSQDSRTVGMGSMPKWKFLVRNYGLTEQEAKQWIAEVQAEQPQDFFQGGSA